MTPEEKAAHDALTNEVKSIVDKAVENKANSNEVAELKEKLNNAVSKEDFEAVKAEAIKLAGEIAALKEVGTENSKPVSIKEQVKGWVEANKAALQSISSGTKAELKPLVVKVNSPMTPANSYNSSSYLPIPEFQMGANEIVRVQPTFWDYLRKGRTSSAAYVWINKKNPLGAAGFIGPGVAKPGVSFEIATEISNAKKVAVSEKCATELLQDIEGMASWIEQEIAYQLKAKINTTLMTGVASATVPAGIQTLSVPYSLTTIKTTNPNYWDAVRAAVAQIRSGNLVGTVTVFVNPVDKANMDLTKAQSQGQLFVPGDAGAVIVEDNNIPVGYFQAAILDYYKILIYQDFSLTWGWENDDFTKNLVTAIGEMRLHQMFSENYTGAFVYDTFDNVKTALTQA